MNLIEPVIVLTTSLATGIIGMIIGKWLWKKWQTRFDKRKMTEFLSNGKYELIHVYKTKAKFNGAHQNFYTLRNALQMPAERAISAEGLANQADMNITRAELLRFITKIKEEAQSGKFTAALLYLEKIAERLEWIGEETTILNLAKVYFFLDGESPECPMPKFDDLKEKIFNDEPEARSFFLQAGLTLTGKYGDILQTDILPYLANKRIEKQQMTRQFQSIGSSSEKK